MGEGAEARLYKSTRNGETVFVKDRIPKAYREQTLDARIRRQRTRREETLLRTAGRAGIPVPHVLERQDNTLVLEFVPGKVLRNTLGKKNLHWCAIAGKQVAQLHAQGIIHGDLTTSNMIVSGKKLVFVDFGLGRTGNKTEDRAVDLLNLKKTLLATHSRVFENAWKNVIAGYLEGTGEQSVLHRLEKIEARARYKGGV